jgi:hypothetical protein
LLLRDRKLSGVRFSLRYFTDNLYVNAAFAQCL